MLARGAAARGPRLATLASRPPTIAPSPGPPDPGRPALVDLVVAGLDEVAIRSRHREPETVIAWHRRAFRLWWTWKSRRRLGRPTVPPAVRALIRTMSQANPLWGAPRIHGELLKLGIDVSQASVAKYLVRPRRPPSQSWRNFLANHVEQIRARISSWCRRRPAACCSFSSSSLTIGGGSCTSRSPRTRPPPGRRSNSAKPVVTARPKCEFVSGSSF